MTTHPFVAVFYQYSVCYWAVFKWSRSSGKDSLGCLGASLQTVFERPECVHPAKWLTKIDWNGISNWIPLLLGPRLVSCQDVTLQLPICIIPMSAAQHPTKRPARRCIPIHLITTELHAMFTTRSSGSLFSTFTADCYAALIEFVGTTFFLVLALGGIQAATGETDSSAVTSNVQHVMYISLSMGFSLTVSAWLFFRVTGGLFNPNISLALLLVGVIGPVRFVLYCIAQLLGGIAAAGLVLALTPGPLASNTILQQGVNAAQGVFIEMFITTGLVLAVLMLAAEKHNTTPFAPIGIGLTLFAGHLFAVYYTGAATNTARSFGPAVVTGFPYAKHWIYWVGPLLGSLFGSGFYATLKHYQYWRLNPDQDTTEVHKSPGDPLDLAHAIISNSVPARGSETNV